MRRFIRNATFAFAALLAATASTAYARPLTEGEVPSSLKGWVPWVMHDVEKSACPFFYTSQDQRICSWPTSLSLSFGRTEGSFAYVITIYDTPDGNPQRVTLPGQTDVWPQDVSVNGADGEVLLYNGLPTLLLSKGEYTIKGTYAWDKMPVSLALPPQMGIVTLVVNGAQVAVPEIEGSQILLQRNEQVAAPTAENGLETKVFRKISDSIPQIVETQLQLNISGKQREEVLGTVLLPGSTPLSIMSDLPARLDNDGKLRAQLRAGTYMITIPARLDVKADHISLPAANGSLPAEEIWSFAAQNQLRLVQVSGGLAIDPSQTELPAAWHSLPTYYLKQGDALDFKEIKRGASEALPDQLNLQRRIWLDFSGSGYTVQDNINGTIKNSSRLEVQDGVKLGSATINGQDQYITTISQDGKTTNPGVEVREGSISMQTNSRFDRDKAVFATGWKSNFDSVSATLFLPPGWTLFNYSGVDSVSSSWISGWTLVDIFMVMIASVAAYRFWGRRLGVVAAIGLVLIHPELRSFTSYLLTAILCLAIARALKPGKLRSAIGLLSKGVVLLMILTSLPFMLSHMRESLYPQLAEGSHGWQMPGGFAGGGGALRQNFVRDDLMDKDAPVAPAAVEAEPMNALPAPVPEQMMDMAGSATSSFESKEGYRGKGAYLARKAMSKADNMIQQQYQSYAPDTKVQTGFGNRNISEYGISLGWNGSVDPMVSMHLWLISAKVNLLLALLRVVLIAVLIAALIGGMFENVREKMRVLFPIVLLAVAVYVLPISDARASEQVMDVQEGVSAPDVKPAGGPFPPPHLLEQLKQKLSESINRPESCLPECASLSRTRIKVAGNQLELELEIHASANVAVPLPGGVGNWRPSAVLVNGAASSALTVDSNGYLNARLSKGVSKVRMIGAVASNRDTIGITFPLASRFTSADVSGWAVQGIHDNGVTDNSVQINRTERAAVSAQQEAGNNFEKTSLPPYYQVERTIALGNRWEVSTLVRKLTPADGPSAVEVPLLEGESVTSSDTEVKNGKAYASFDPGESEVYFTSVLPQSDLLALSAPTDTPWVEVWKLSASNLWHVKADGIPRIYESNQATQDTANIMPPGASGYSLWMPWPGEKLSLTIERPAGVEGATRTIDGSTLRLMPSDRSVDASLDITIRSSLGGQHDVTLPEGAVLSGVTRDGLTIPSQMKGSVLNLPLTPGTNNYSLRWKEPRALGVTYSPSKIDIGAERSVNSVINVRMPQNRWVLFTFGPVKGPAVLFWSWIPIILILAFGLGKIESTPLRMRHWFIMLLGMSFSSTAGIVMIIAWVLAFGWRGTSEHTDMGSAKFNLVQLVLVGLTLFVMPMLFDTIRNGLLGYPQMNIQGNGSYAYQLNWYQDITGSTLPQPTVLSVPLWLYRVLMLLWALWLAFKVVSWLRWAWDGFTRGGYWRKVFTSKPKKSDDEKEDDSKNESYDLKDK